MVKNLLCNAGATEDVASIVGWEDSLEEEMTTTLVFLPGESCGHMQSQRVGHD